MQWMELSLDTTHEAVDWVCTLLAGTDYTGDVHITLYMETDLSYPVAQEQDVVKPSWAFTIYLCLPYDVRVSESIEKIVNLLSPLQRVGLTTALRTARVDEKSAYAAEESPLVHRIGQRFVVLTSDAPYQSAPTKDVTIRLKKALCFGSGLHPTTVVSLKLLERYVVPNMNVLDLGSGSGILSIAMAKLGASVLALDNDKVAFQATTDAVRLNGVERQVRVKVGSLGCGSNLGHWMSGNSTDNVPSINAIANFDLIVANILARVHIVLAPDLRRALRRTDTQAGILITSGFTTAQEDDVSIALAEAGFVAVDCERCNEWVALAHYLKG